MPEVERSITILPRVRRQLPARAAAELPAQHRRGAVQTHHADAEDCVEYFEHYSSSSSSPLSSPLLLNILSDHFLCSKLMWYTSIAIGPSDNTISASNRL